jgi:hypothetical protein
MYFWTCILEVTVLNLGQFTVYPAWDFGVLLITCKSTLKKKPCPNVVVEWSAFLLHTWQVSGSDLGPETDYYE